MQDRGRPASLEATFYRRRVQPWLDAKHGSDPLGFNLRAWQTGEVQIPPIKVANMTTVPRWRGAVTSRDGSCTARPPTGDLSRLCQPHQRDQKPLLEGGEPEPLTFVVP